MVENKIHSYAGVAIPECSNYADLKRKENRFEVRFSYGFVEMIEPGIHLAINRRLLVPLGCLDPTSERIDFVLPDYIQ